MKIIIMIKKIIHINYVMKDVKNVVNQETLLIIIVINVKMDIILYIIKKGIV